MSLYFAATKSAVDTLTMVSATTGTVAQSATALSHLAATAAAHAEDYHTTTVGALADTQDARIASRRLTLATDVAHKMLNIKTELRANPALQAEYDLIIAAFQASDAKREALAKANANPD